jgi:hypothetical protein
MLNSLGCDTNNQEKIWYEKPFYVFMRYFDQQETRTILFKAL